jgi:hypothetical protein
MAFTRQVSCSTSQAGLQDSFAAANIHVRMLNDRQRTGTYLAAIGEVVDLATSSWTSGRELAYWPLPLQGPAPGASIARPGDHRPRAQTVAGLVWD